VTSSQTYDLQRFLDAQDRVIDAVLAELRSGTKRGHWMWFVFPQLAGLGHSAMSRRYAIGSLGEAKAYLAHPTLGRRLRECVEAAVQWSGERNATAIFGPIDAMKLRSSLTLFAASAPEDPLFERTLAAFFGSADPQTLRLLER
jgi:uncharacterized protein (DUF1810 family)